MKDLNIRDLLLKSNRPLVSLEFFPPKDTRGFAILGSSIERMRVLRADFVTVTYGAGGGTRGATSTVCDVLQQMGFGPVMPHLTCVGSPAGELADQAAAWKATGYRNIMTLRGDPPKEAAAFRPAPGGLAHASDLVALLHERYPDLCLGVAGYPETHPEALSPELDIAFLKAKLDAGASFVTTQLFFDNRYYFDFVRRCREAGIHQPILPGLLPPVSLQQVERMTSLCRAAFPEDLSRAMRDAGGSGSVAEAIGVGWTVRQINELCERGAPGVHLYILNRARTALAPELVECLNDWRG